ncbi:unnamed protein product, partial [Linum tenue]
LRRRTPRRRHRHCLHRLQRRRSSVRPRLRRRRLRRRHPRPRIHPSRPLVLLPPKLAQKPPRLRPSLGRRPGHRALRRDIRRLDDQSRRRRRRHHLEVRQIMVRTLPAGRSRLLVDGGLLQRLVYRREAPPHQDAHHEIQRIRRRRGQNRLSVAEGAGLTLQPPETR